MSIGPTSSARADCLALRLQFRRVHGFPLIRPLRKSSLKGHCPICSISGDDCAGRMWFVARRAQVHREKPLLRQCARPGWAVRLGANATRKTSLHGNSQFVLRCSFWLLLNLCPPQFTRQFQGFAPRQVRLTRWENRTLLCEPTLEREHSAPPRWRAAEELERLSLLDALSD